MTYTVGTEQTDLAYTYRRKSVSIPFCRFSMEDLLLINFDAMLENRRRTYRFFFYDLQIPKIGTCLAISYD